MPCGGLKREIERGEVSEKRNAERNQLARHSYPNKFDKKNLNRVYGGGSDFQSKRVKSFLARRNYGVNDDAAEVSPTRVLAAASYMGGSRKKNRQKKEG